MDLRQRTAPQKATPSHVPSKKTQQTLRADCRKRRRDSTCTPTDAEIRPSAHTRQTVSECIKIPPESEQVPPTHTNRPVDGKNVQTGYKFRPHARNRPFASRKTGRGAQSLPTHPTSRQRRRARPLRRGHPPPRSLGLGLLLDDMVGSGWTPGGGVGAAPAGRFGAGVAAGAGFGAIGTLTPRPGREPQGRKGA